MSAKYTFWNANEEQRITDALGCTYTALRNLRMSRLSMYHPDVKEAIELLSKADALLAETMRNPLKTDME
ncbi:hypothetical protein [Vibrio parahaemolyticus]|uniref:hypothetical protein n=1 Tax=Vibrio parahaemolyticus TaxID=670 RepID=UPI00301CDCB7